MCNFFLYKGQIQQDENVGQNVALFLRKQIKPWNFSHTGVDSQTQLV